MEKSLDYMAISCQKLSLGNFELRSVKPADIESIRQWRNAQMDILRQSKPIDFQQQIDYYDKYIWPTMTHLRPSNILLGLLRNQQLIGYGGLVHIAWEDVRAEISFLLSPERVKSDSIYIADFSDFLILIKQLAFKNLKLHRLYAETYDIRPLHTMTLESNGFTREGVLRDHVRINGLAVDSIIHGCLNSL